MPIHNSVSRPDNELNRGVEAHLAQHPPEYGVQSEYSSVPVTAQRPSTVPAVGPEVRSQEDQALHEIRILHLIAFAQFLLGLIWGAEEYWLMTFALLPILGVIFVRKFAWWGALPLIVFACGDSALRIVLALNKSLAWGIAAGALTLVHAICVWKISVWMRLIWTMDPATMAATRSTFATSPLFKPRNIMLMWRVRLNQPVGGVGAGAGRGMGQRAQLGRV